MLGFVCDERTRLLNEYKSTTLELSARVAKLIDNTGTTPQRDYNLLKNVADLARIAAEQARLNLEKHIVEHGCISDEEE